jgi:hypothetical protein
MRNDSVEQLRVELVNLLQRQVEALELETYVGLTDAELREFYKRQERGGAVGDWFGFADPSGAKSLSGRP